MPPSGPSSAENTATSTPTPTLSGPTPNQETAPALPEPPKAAPADKKCRGLSCASHVEPLRMCGTCSYFYCKNCCQKCQTITGPCRKESRHAAEGPSLTATNGSSPNT